MFAKLANKIASRLKRLRCLTAPRRLVRSKDGAVGVEFGLLALPFMAVTYATLETGLIFFSGQVLEMAVADSSRLILTYQAQSNTNFDANSFKTEICNRVFTLFDCMGGLKVDVRTAASFAAANVSKPLDSNGNLQNNFTYDPGARGSIVVVRAMYVWPLKLSIAGYNLTDMAGTNKLLISTAVFRNEP